MFSISAYHRPSRRELRSFGLILAAGFLVIGILPVALRNSNPVRWALGLCVLFAVLGVLLPGALRHVHRVWMTLGYVLGWINSKVMLGLLYYVAVTPLRLVIKLSGRDPMNRNFDLQTQTYRVVRKTRPVSHMKHQF